MESVLCVIQVPDLLSAPTSEPWYQFHDVSSMELSGYPCSPWLWATDVLGSVVRGSTDVAHVICTVVCFPLLVLQLTYNTRKKSTCVLVPCFVATTTL